MIEHVQDMHKLTDTTLALKVRKASEAGLNVPGEYADHLAQQVLDLAAEVERLNAIWPQAAAWEIRCIEADRSVEGLRGQRDVQTRRAEASEARNARLEAVAEVAHDHLHQDGATMYKCELCKALVALDAK